jgi:hypothetical protein
VLAGLAGLLATTRSGRDWAATGPEAERLDAPQPAPNDTRSDAADTEVL